VDRQCGRIPSLDGLRALSISLVVFGHLGGTAGFPIGSPRVVLPFLAVLGVRVFFVISGYLITRLLLEEQEKHGSICLSMFYFRRIFRILVPYYVFLVAMAAAARMGWVELGPGDLGYALAYIGNYHPHSAWTLGHTWSLAVEEQFYLLWPAVLVLFGVRRAMWVATASLFIAPLVRVGVWTLLPASRDGVGHTFGTVVDPLAVGCLLAGISDHLWQDARYRALLKSRWFSLVPLAVLSTVVFEQRPRFAFTIAPAVISVGVALCVDRCVRLPGSLWTKALTIAPIVAVGRASYSIYLWQQPFLNRFTSGLAARFPQNIIAAAVVATIAFFLVEKPALAARQALEGRLRRVLLGPRRPSTVRPSPAGPDAIAA
jgi:peptidoglycan/LPS O-acetylase OafA/YrhL